MGIDNFFIAIYNYFEKHRGRMWVAAVSSFLLIGFFASRIKLEEDITSILPHEKKLDKQQQVFQDSRFSDKLAVSISQKDTTAPSAPDELTAFADSFIEKATAIIPQYIKQIDGRVNDSSINLMDGIQADLPVFLGKNDYDTIDTLITPGKIKQQLAWDYNKLISPEGIGLKKIIQADPAGISWLGIKKLKQLQVGDQFELYDGYVMTKDHRHLVVFITPANPANATGKNGIFLKGLDVILDSLQQQFPKIDASYFGGVAVSAGNAAQLRKDTLLTQGITVILLILFIGFYFRKKRAPLVIMMPVLFGGLFSLAIIYFIKGHISVVALGAGSIVLGIAVNYSLHVFNHYRHLPDMRDVIKDVASPMTIGSFTTIGGFLCLMLVPSPLLNDMGLFAAFSLVGATLCSLIFLPHWIEGGRKEQYTHEHVHEKSSWIDKLSEYKPEKNKYLVAGIFVLTIVFFFTAYRVSFENDMMRMNFMSSKLQESEKKFNAINSYVARSVYLVAEGNDLEEALENNERIQPILQQLQQQGSIKKIAGVADLLLSAKEQQARIDRWNEYWTASRKQQLLSELKKIGETYHFKPDAFDEFEQLLNKKYTVTQPKDLAVMGSGALGNYLIEKHGKVSVVTLLKVDPAQKDIVYKALDNKPNITVLDKQYATNSLVTEINNEFNNIAWMTSLLVFIALFISYGRIELTLITFIPMLISWIWILGIMGIFGIKFNIVNIILSTFIFGLGDDYSIFIMDGLLQQYKTGKKHLSSFKSSIFLSAITTILGLGILIFAKHPSLKSIAVISIVGIGCVVLTSQVLIPFLFNWLITNRVKKGYAPWTFFGWAKSVFAFTYFAAGCYLMTFLGILLIKLYPFNKAKGKYLYHRILSKYTWSVLYIMGNVKKTFLNPLNDNLSKPAVIISNHQSFLDILVSTALNPKVILLTNQWVWRSPVFGAVVRLADYYPVADGVEDSLDKLKEKVLMGYSIAVYPEGTRSPQADIKRFHKGAFYIAEKLGLDILPVVIHGTAYTMTKGDFLLKDGVITVKYLPRIEQRDGKWGHGYHERSKSITRYFREEYEKIREEIETPKYYREQLIYNYLYKGPVLEWYMRIKTKLEKNYEQFHKLLPLQGKILDIGCGYGFMSYMLHFLSEERYITGVDFDEEKIETANHCYLKTDNINFICADVVKYSFDTHDAFIISDVLHYLQPDEQELLLQKCINNLAPHGVIIVRDGDTELAQRQKGTALTEFFSTKAIGFNKTSGKPLSFLSSSHIREVAAKYGASVEQIDNTRYTSNVIFIIRKIPFLAYV
jgi:1-acyl-sn-glycerol-3-phosphate acyltransferase